MNNFKKLCFLNIQQLTNFPYIEEDFDALTNYELLCKIVEYLNKVIENDNKQNESILALYNAFNELENYVDNFFDNLDVQDEINNKLDEMAATGELTDIIAQYLGLAGMFTYDTVADMKLAENLVNGSKCTTLGYYSLNDGGKATYKIRTVTNDDVIDEMFILEVYDNSLVAELIIENDEVNLKELGIKGDNSTDETLKLQNVFSKNYNIFINDGTYITNDELTISNPITIKGDVNSLIKAKQGMAIDKAILKVMSDNVTIDSVNLSGNIEENPIGDVYNGSHGISLIDTIASSNITIKNCILKDNAYVAYRLRSVAPNTNTKHINFINNKCLTVDCGIESMSNATNTMNLEDIHIESNTFDGHDRSEPITLFHYGTSKNVVITNNIICNKPHANGILSQYATVNNIIVTDNMLSDIAVGIRIENATNGNISNNVIIGANSNIYEGIILENCSNIKVDNNITKNTTNESMRIKNCNHIYINDNFFNGINITEIDSYKEGIRLESSTYIYCKNNAGIGLQYSYLYNLFGTCSNIYIEENDNPSDVVYGFGFGYLSSNLTNSKISTNLNIRSNIGTKLDSNTNKIEQTGLIIESGFNNNAAFKLAHTKSIKINTNTTLSTYPVYNPIDYDIYEFNIYPTANLTLTSDSVSDNGIIFKEDRVISTPTKLTLMYYNGKLYEI